MLLLAVPVFAYPIFKILTRNLFFILFKKVSGNSHELSHSIGLKTGQNRPKMVQNLI
jgi:hypothetical protein